MAGVGAFIGGTEGALCGDAVAAGATRLRFPSWRNWRFHYGDASRFLGRDVALR
uniref:Uncharacterized protein n=1 Tax=Magnetospirillum gryphiswaldense TaxID=55518 RepID=A4U1W2_9PROT|nr:hypothetical protein MGR_0173 [Magnetospirillum gryphiswaldense MSR-1]